MNLEKTADGTKLTVALVGEVDSMNVAKIEEKLLAEVGEVTDLVFDIKKFEYLSSSVLRVLL